MDNHVVVPFDLSSPESCLESIKNVRDELLSSRAKGRDVYIEYQIGGRRLDLITKRNDLYCDRFRVDGGRIWSLNGGSGGIRNGFLNIGESYERLTGKLGGVTNVVVGFPRFELAFYDIVRRFTVGGNNVTDERGTKPKDWTLKLGNGLASLIVMTLESCRSFWIDGDYGRLITDHRYEMREVSGPEGGLMLGWKKASGFSRLAMESSGEIWRSSPLEDEDLNALEDPIHARDCVAVRSIP